jgi:sulfopyruvate decarboxylase subunit alpha
VSAVQALTARHEEGDAEARWQRELADAFVEAGIEVAAWVPDKRLAPIAARLAERRIPLRTLPREEECFGYAAGYRAAGGMPLVMIQCSGLGNSLNAIGSLVIPYGLGFPAVISMRGTLGERNPSQMPLGRTTTGTLDLLGVQAFSLAAPEDARRLVKGAIAVAEGARTLAPILLEGELELA